MLILGYDPGGRKGNGVAILRSREGVCASGLCNTFDFVDQVIKWIDEQRAGESIDAAGIDSLLSWSTGSAGWRPMDDALRKTYKEVAKSIISPNGLYGSMAIQGMAFAVRMRETCPQIIINETHPKVLYYAIAGQKHDFKSNNASMKKWIQKQLKLPSEVGVSNEHEWDALLSAWAAWMGLMGKWRVDLMSLAAIEKLIKPAGDVTYFWPSDTR